MYKIQDVDHSSEANRDFLYSGNNRLSSGYLNKKVLTEEEIIGRELQWNFNMHFLPKLKSHSKLVKKVLVKLEITQMEPSPPSSRQVSFTC